MALHFSNFDLAPECIMTVSGKKRNVLGEKEEYEMVGRGKMQLGTFWARHVSGDEIFLKVKCNGSQVKDHGNFVVDKLAVGFAPDQGRRTTTTRRAAICNADDKANAICYENSDPPEYYDKGRAVARLLIQGSSLCTGWLVSGSNHLMTNQHCIGSSSDALNTDYEFGSENPYCDSSECPWWWPWCADGVQLGNPGQVFDEAVLISSDAPLDYALIQISNGDPAASYGYLEVDNRDATVGEQIYIPQHPGGRPKEFGIDDDINGGTCQIDAMARPCTGSGYDDVGCKSTCFCTVSYRNIVSENSYIETWFFPNPSLYYRLL